MSVIIRTRDPRQVEDEAEERILIATFITSYDGSIVELLQDENGTEGDEGMERMNETSELTVVIRMRDPRQVEDEAEERIIVATSVASYDGSIEEFFQDGNRAGDGGMERLVGQPREEHEPLFLEDMAVEEFDDSFEERH